ncbi:MAG: hypothetical protein LC650_03870 [Actinobacteria bacterium]|nr:hypothetical protein [Actinomycetota bacterium]
MERQTDPREVISDLISDGTPADAEALIAALLDDELNALTAAAIEIARNEY